MPSTVHIIVKAVLFVQRLVVISSSLLDGQTSRFIGILGLPAGYLDVSSAAS